MAELKDIEVQEVSIVDEGANPGAEMILAKRKEAEDFYQRLEKRISERLDKIEEAELIKVASKYEILGEKPDELAKILKSAKGTELYDKTISLLDRELELVEKSNLYNEIGKSGSQNVGNVEEIAKRIQAQDKNISWRQALDKAYLEAKQ